MQQNKLNIPNLSILQKGIDVADPDAPENKGGFQLPADLAQHRGFARTFQQGKLSFGLIAPFKGYPGHIAEVITDLGDTAQLAEKFGFSTLWVRDVPFYDPNFGDVGQGFDPMVTLGYLAAKTKKIAIGTAGIISPLRSPIHIAKAAASADILSEGRFLLGLSSGDRPIEYPLFQQNFSNRGERFRESVEMIQALLTQTFPTWKGEFYGQINGDVDMIPKSQHRIPIITVGRARQELDWLATKSDAWIWYSANGAQAKKVIDTLADLGDGKTWHPFSTAGFVELLEDTNAPARLFNGVYLRGGSKAVAEFYADLHANGVSHISMNLKPTKRPIAEVMQDLAENVLAKFK